MRKKGGVGMSRRQYFILILTAVLFVVYPISEWASPIIAGLFGGVLGAISNEFERVAKTNPRNKE